jgi:hypothetical protein
MSFCVWSSTILMINGYAGEPEFVFAFLLLEYYISIMRVLHEVMLKYLYVTHVVPIKYA